ncbi:hypothetical protein DS742_13940 [Lacrimispora amygdalina]|uniref:Uncharacterized protein n=1 Tax=Lacrimispora amygdalina TaxID=253257 RepID=A0A3E2NB19_9FIRM|nr:hypothetical protein [Clostridium indicum]RFZ78215.1 hypothetical protein DS742_13940 [Clostridium indicum]
MNEVLQNINIMEVLSTIWTVVLVPILGYAWKQIYAWTETKKLDKYASILYEEVVKSVKSVYEVEVKHIKKTSDWTPEKQEEVKELAKTKVCQALSTSIYRSLKEANSDFEDYLDSLVGTALFDIKNKAL